MINRLVEPTAGAIRIDGKDNRVACPARAAPQIGYAIQGHGLFPHRTVGAEHRHRAGAARLGQAPASTPASTNCSTLFQLDPGEYRDRDTRTSSRAASSSASASPARWPPSPNVLLMDEPFGALDPIIRAKAQDDLLAIQKRFGTTIVLVTHDMDEAIHLGDKIAVMDEGKLLQYAHAGRDPAPSRPTAFVAELIGTGERPFRLLSLGRVRDAVEPGDAPKASRSPATPACAMRWPSCCGRGRRGAAGQRRRRQAARPRHRRRRWSSARRGRHEGLAAILSACRCWRCSSPSSSRPSCFAPLFAAADQERRAGDLHSGQPADADALPSAIVLIATVAAHPGRGRRSPSSSPGRSAPSSCRCRAASPISARPFRRWRCWRSRCPSSASATAPTLIALFLYGLLPIFENTLTGLTTLPRHGHRGRARHGHDRLAAAVEVELPLALPVILAGIRLSVVIALATATIGSTVAAKTLGEVIIAGLLSNNTAFVLQGGLIVGVLAVLIYDGLSAIERYTARRMGQETERLILGGAVRHG